ncbi:MAG: family 78 glycoside hydrolase catalytic domain, partial [Candidatus Hydrogenedentes bacterium]|nr:family 78 glycoside hydrolase catalytic domain [Candidatus Hydrogenedentota bacterium]
MFDGAEWIRDPVFDGIEVIDLFHKADADKPALSGPRHVHTCFRKVIELPASPAKAVLAVTGDDYYKLYMNGAFVVQGPEPAYPSQHPYYLLDVTDALRAGQNCLAAHAYYQGLLNRVWNSADNRSGFMLALDVTFPSGRTARYVTDATWRCRRLDAFPEDRTIGYQTQFAEDIRMDAIPAGWRSAGFDDSGWDAPLTGRQDHVFVEQPTPPLQVRRAEPVLVKDKGDGRFFYDFGTELVGCTRIRLHGPTGHTIEVRHGEELLGPDEVRFDMRANCTYQEFPVLSGHDDLIEFYDYRAFRYIEILNAPAEPEVWVDVRHHPFDAAASRFDASDDVLARIWELCKNGVRYGAQGVFVDCPSREKGQYLGDTLIVSRSHLTLTAAPTLSRKAIADFQASQRICPGIMAVAPGSFMQEFTEYSLQWPMLLRNYLWATGDTEFATRMADAAFPAFFAYFAEYESDAGLLVGGAGKPILVDWPKNLRDDYDLECSRERENAVVNAFYYASYRAAADVLTALGRDASAC